MKLRTFLMILLVLMVTACQGEPYHGSRIIANLYFANIDAASLVTPTRVYIQGSERFLQLQPGDTNYVDHYELYAGIEGVGTVRLLNFLIRPAMEVHHPCLQFIEDLVRVDGEGEGPFYLNMCRSPFPDLERQEFFVVAAAPTDVGTANPGYDYWTWGANLLEPDSPVEPNCSQNIRMKYNREAVEAFCSQLHPDVYVPNPYQLTKPRSGRYLGVLDGIDPRTNLATGGISLTVDYKLDKVTSLFIVAEPDPTRLSQENFHKNLPPGQGKIILLSELNSYYGYIDKKNFEGVWHGLMVNPEGLPLYFEYTIYYNIDKDKVWF